jgi:hypothetical protein
MAAAAPAYFFRRESIDFIARCHGRLGSRIGGELAVINERSRHQRRGLRAGGERCASSNKSKRKFQKVPPFHRTSSSFWLTRERECRCHEMNVG